MPGAICSPGSRARCATPARIPAQPSADDLAGVDEFHSRGREATSSWRELLPPAVDTELLDIGSGLGGPARFLAATRGYRVVGVDLTPEYVDGRQRADPPLRPGRPGAVRDRRRAATCRSRTAASPPPIPSTRR